MNMLEYIKGWFKKKEPLSEVWYITFPSCYKVINQKEYLELRTLIDNNKKIFDRFIKQNETKLARIIKDLRLKNESR